MKGVTIVPSKQDQWNWASKQICPDINSPLAEHEADVEVFRYKTVQLWIVIQPKGYHHCTFPPSCPPLWLESAASPLLCPTSVSCWCAESAKNTREDSASPALASPSLKLTTPAQSARQRRGLWGCACVCSVNMWVHINVCWSLSSTIQSMFFFFFSFSKHAACCICIYVVGWAAIQHQWTRSMKHTVVMCHIIQKTKHKYVGHQKHD